jgi:hypothetical protein
MMGNQGADGLSGLAKILSEISELIKFAVEISGSPCHSGFR